MELQLQEIREYQKQYGINSLWAEENTFHAVITCYIHWPY